MDYIIYCDLDGVLVDFDKGYYELTGQHTTYADRHGSKYFWDLYQESLEKNDISAYRYWADLDWMPDGKKLWDYIKKHNPHILTAPAIKDLPKEKAYNIKYNPSMQGKFNWTRRLDNVNKVKFKGTKQKHVLSGENKILIDDRADTIERWNNAGGIGIYHTSTENTIKQLKQLGL